MASRNVGCFLRWPFGINRFSRNRFWLIWLKCSQSLGPLFGWNTVIIIFIGWVRLGRVISRPCAVAHAALAEAAGKMAEYFFLGMEKRAIKTCNLSCNVHCCKYEFKSDVARFTTQKSNQFCNNIKLLHVAKKLLQKVERSPTFCNKFCTCCAFYRLRETLFGSKWPSPVYDVCYLEVRCYPLYKYILTLPNSWCLVSCPKL